MGDSNLTIMIQQGGAIFYVILGLSVIALGLVFERLMALGRASRADVAFLAQFNALISQSPTQEKVIELCEADGSGLSELVAVAAKNAEFGMLALRRIVLDHLATQVRPTLEQNVNWLVTIGRVSPMLGLFGTVYGMMGAFNEMANAATQANPKDLAGDINVALATTVGGLFVALLVIGFHSFVMHRVKARLQQYHRFIADVLKPISKISPA